MITGTGPHTSAAVVNARAASPSSNRSHGAIGSGVDGREHFVGSGPRIGCPRHYFIGQFVPAVAGTYLTGSPVEAVGNDLAEFLTQPEGAATFEFA